MHDGDDLDDFFQTDSSGAPAEDLAAPEPIEGPLIVPPRLGLLAKLDMDDFSAVARTAQLKHLDAGTVVFREGDTADRFFILIDGQVEVRRGEVVVATLQPGEFFGESALFRGGRRSASVVVTAQSSLWSIDYATFERVVSHELLADESTRSEVEARIRSTPDDQN